MVTTNRKITPIEFSIAGPFSTGYVVSPMIGLQLNTVPVIGLSTFSAEYGLSTSSHDGTELSFKTKFFIAIDFKKEKPDAEALYKLLDEFCDDSYRLLMGAMSQAGYNRIPQKPEFDKTEILNIIQSEIDYNLSKKQSPF